MLVSLIFVKTALILYVMCLYPIIRVYFITVICIYLRNKLKYRIPILHSYYYYTIVHVVTCS